MAIRLRDVEEMADIRKEKTYPEVTKSEGYCPMKDLALGIRSLIDGTPINAEAYKGKVGEVEEHAAEGCGICASNIGPLRRIINLTKKREPEEKTFSIKLGI